MIIINNIINIFFIGLAIQSIIQGEIGTLIFLILSIVILVLNTICIISKNKKIYNIEESYFIFIRQISIYQDENKYEELKKYLENARKSGLYKRFRRENSDLPVLEDIYDWHEQDRI